MSPSLSHSLLALAIFGLGALFWLLGLNGPQWQGAFAAIAWFWSRELAQKWRSLTNPGPPLTMANLRQAGWPSIVVLLLAIAITIIDRNLLRWALS